MGADGRIEIVVSDLPSRGLWTTSSGTGPGAGAEKSYVSFDDIGSWEDGDHCQEREESREGKSMDMHGFCFVLFVNETEVGVYV